MIPKGLGRFTVVKIIKRDITRVEFDVHKNCNCHMMIAGDYWSFISLIIGRMASVSGSGVYVPARTITR